MLTSKQTPKYPILIVSKGRAESRLTVKSLEEMGVDYRIFVEPQEERAYAAVIDSDKIVVLPFSNLGLGSIPARNYAFEYAVELGAARHWILDDNIRRFYRWNLNRKIPVLSGAYFRAMEDFVDRYENIALAGPNYLYLSKKKYPEPPVRLNTRVYSCILVNHAIAYRWRGRYNEDTDLSLRVLKDGWVTALFTAFLCGKQATMTMKGGNTEELYKITETSDGRLEMARELKRRHPEETRIVFKWGRWQHSVDYRKFKANKLVERAGVVDAAIDEYGMQLVDTSAE